MFPPFCLLSIREAIMTSQYFVFVYSYAKLYKETDGDEYKVESYYDIENEVAAKFIFMLLMKNQVYPAEFRKQFYTVTIDP